MSEEIIDNETDGGAKALRWIYVTLLLLLAVAGGFVAYSLVRGVQAPRTRVERDIMLYRDLTKRNPKDVNMWMSLGHAYLDSKDYDAAIGAFNDALKLNPKTTDAKVAIALTYQQMGDNDKAVKSFEEIVKAQPSNDIARLALARARFDKGDYQEALALVRQLEKSDAGEADVYYLAGQIYEKLGKKTSAKAEYEKIFKLDPASADAKSAIERLGI
ncbi:MAG: tetratricopeptide repeat protein [Actinobacteria bacterium]|nr:tetratricopeptide repeat protein [Actinomycetota bacterium]